MKKFFALTALVLAATGSWAFYPKTTEPSGYMMVIGRVYNNYSLVTVSPTGETDTQVIDDKTHGNSVNKEIVASEQLYQAEIRKINSLKQVGWKVTSVSVHSSQSLIHHEDVYLLEK